MPGEPAYQIALASSVTRRDSKLTRCFGDEFVVAAAEVLDEGDPGDYHLGGAVGAQPAHGPQSVFESAVVGFDPVGLVAFDVVPGC
jgi:hypothetical protein